MMILMIIHNASSTTNSSSNTAYTRGTNDDTDNRTSTIAQVGFPMAPPVDFDHIVGGPPVHRGLYGQTPYQDPLH